MQRTPTRTELVDATTQQVELWRQTATRALTASRAYNDYAKDVETVTTKGDVADEVADDIATWCRDKAVEYRELSAELNRQADRLERDLR